MDSAQGIQLCHFDFSSPLSRNSTLKGQIFLLKEQILFCWRILLLERLCSTGKQTGSHESCSPWQKWWYNMVLYPFTIRHMVTCPREITDGEVFAVCQLLMERICPFYAPPQKVAGYYVIPFELLSVCLSVHPSVRPSAVEHSCPVHNFDTVRDNFTKLGTNINHDQTTCRD